MFRIGDHVIFTKTGEATTFGGHRTAGDKGIVKSIKPYLKDNQLLLWVHVELEYGGSWNANAVDLALDTSLTFYTIYDKTADYHLTSIYNSLKEAQIRYQSWVKSQPEGHEVYIMQALQHWREV